MTQPASSSSAAAGLPATVDVLAAEMVLLYTQAEQQLLTNLAGMVDLPALEIATAMRREAVRIATALRLRSYPLAMQIAQLAAERGNSAAATELRRIVESSPRVAALVNPVRDVAPVTSLGLDLAQRLDSTLPGVIRFADDAYRAATFTGATFGISPEGTPALAQQLAWRQLTERGISGFTDRTGRRWNLASYVEMATRTAIQQAYNDAHLARMVAAGVEHFTVTDDGHPCPLCKPWQGRVLTIAGPSPTISEARAAGLWHPNCRHALVAYFPGISKFPAPTPWTDTDQARYDATQHLRALEREVRAHKRAGEAALTPLDARRARVKARGTQARIRAHVDRHGLVRRTRREQLDLGNS